MATVLFSSSWPPPSFAPSLTLTRIIRTQNFTRRVGPAACWKRAPRRFFLGLGAAPLLDQVSRMAAAPGGGSGSGGQPFAASARPQVSPVEQVLKNMEWPEKFPFKDEDFTRFDELPDTNFYSEPHFVTHIDDPAIAALTKYYSNVFPPSNTQGVCLLDMCSSWVSHYPPGYQQDRIVGMGLNDEELKRNPVLTEYIVQDLNANPKLPFDDNTFDVITNVVSVDYLTKPLLVFKEMQRILKEGGLAIMSFSNRCFWTKAITIWTSTGDLIMHGSSGLTSIMLEVLNHLWLSTYLPTLGARIQCMWCILERNQLHNHRLQKIGMSIIKSKCQ